MRIWLALGVAVAVWAAQASGAQEGKPLHVVYTSDVRGTVGVCG